LMLRTHGITKDPEKLHTWHGGWYYEMQTLGYNYRLSDLNCALGLSQLKRADLGLSRRHSIAKTYDAAFADLDFKLTRRDENTGHAWHLYVIQTDYRPELYCYLHSNGVLAQVHYVPVHLMPWYQRKGWRKGMFPHAEAYYERGLSLPMYPGLSSAEQLKVIEHINSFHYATLSDHSRLRRKAGKLFTPL